ncbi:MAG: hypothetical protein LBE20_02740, partial [Deltaproteobacteria bacterium]|nr:hypothetical protein [Deltaproteobacteria bacterium]
MNSLLKVAGGGGGNVIITGSYILGLEKNYHRSRLNKNHHRPTIGLEKNHHNQRLEKNYHSPIGLDKNHNRSIVINRNLWAMLFGIHHLQNPKTWSSSKFQNHDEQFQKLRKNSGIKTVLL